MDIIKEVKNTKRIFKKKTNVFLMAHKHLDLDALGSCVGFYEILKNQRKSCYIIIDDKIHETGVAKVLQELEGVVNIIHSSNIDNYLSSKKNKNLLVILDTNKKELVQNSDILNKIEDKLIIDHHETGKTTIKSKYSIIDTSLSSTCELVSMYIEVCNSKIDPYFATLVLSGIVLDTNNYTLKTTENTYYAAYYLTSIGASPKKVQYLLKQDLEEYSERQKLLTDIKVVKKSIALTKGTQFSTYSREDLAKTADTLLFFNNIEASFVIAKLDKDTVGVSARSLGTYNINNILKGIGGGGTIYNGAAQFDDMPISEVEKLVKEEILKEMGE